MLGVGLHDLAGPVGVALGDGVDQRGVLLPGGPAALAGHRRVVPADAAGDLGGEVAEHGVAGQLHDGGVQLGVDGHRAVDVVGLDGGQAARAERAQPGHPLVGVVAGRQPRGLGLEEGAYGQQLVGLLGGGGVHEGSVPGVQVDPALAAEQLECLPDRLPGDAEHLGELALGEMLARTEVAADDELEERIENALSERNGTRDLECGCPARGNRPRHFFNSRRCQGRSRRARQKFFVNCLQHTVLCSLPYGESDHPCDRLHPLPRN